MSFLTTSCFRSQSRRTFASVKNVLFFYICYQMNLMLEKLSTIHWCFMVSFHIPWNCCTILCKICYHKWIRAHSSTTWGSIFETCQSPWQLTPKTSVKHRNRTILLSYLVELSYFVTLQTGRHAHWPPSRVRGLSAQWCIPYLASSQEHHIHGKHLFLLGRARNPCTRNLRTQKFQWKNRRSIEWRNRSYWLMNPLRSRQKFDSESLQMYLNDKLLKWNAKKCAYFFKTRKFRLW